MINKELESKLLEHAKSATEGYGAHKKEVSSVLENAIGALTSTGKDYFETLWEIHELFVVSGVFDGEKHDAGVPSASRKVVGKSAVAYIVVFTKDSVLHLWDQGSGGRTLSPLGTQNGPLAVEFPFIDMNDLNSVENGIRLVSVFATLVPKDTPDRIASMIYDGFKMDASAAPSKVLVKS